MFPWNAEDLTFDETRFRGKVRLFPLAELVLYPHIMQPLNIFEPRYVEMLNEALDSDGLIAMSVPAGQASAEKRVSGQQSLLPAEQPALLPYACLGKIVTHQRQADGNYSVLLLGVKRVRIEQELSSPRAFRQAEVRLLEDFCLNENDADRAELQAALTQQLQECLPEAQAVPPEMAEMLSADIPLSVLTDLVSFAMPLEHATKCELLSENDIDRRAWILLEALGSLADNQPEKYTGGYLPPFSEN